MFKKWKEVFCTYSLKEKEKAETSLLSHNIPFKLKVKSNAIRNIGAPGIAIERVGENINYTYCYGIFVKSEDYEMAMKCIRDYKNSF